MIIIKALKIFLPQKVSLILKIRKCQILTDWFQLFIKEGILRWNSPDWWDSQISQISGPQSSSKKHAYIIARSALSVCMFLKLTAFVCLSVYLFVRTTCSGSTLDPLTPISAGIVGLEHPQLHTSQWPRNVAALEWHHRTLPPARNCYAKWCLV